LEEAERHLRQLRAQKPAVEFYDTVGNAADWLEMSAVAKLLAKHGYGRNSLFELLREVGVLRGNNEPYQKYVDRGYFRAVEIPIRIGEKIAIRTKTLVSQKGLEFINKILTRISEKKETA
jgi:phage antirepressor YoqD-like protein